MPDSIVKFVDLIEASEATLSGAESVDNGGVGVAGVSGVTGVSSVSGGVSEVQPSPIGDSRRRVTSTRREPLPEEIHMPNQTFSERCMRYVFVVIYLCGLCSLGFFLSVYHLFFWDSRMPPVHKSMIPKKPFYIKP